MVSSLCADDGRFREREIHEFSVDGLLSLLAGFVRLVNTRRQRLEDVNSYTMF